MDAHELEPVGLPRNQPQDAMQRSVPAELAETPGDGARLADHLRVLYRRRWPALTVLVGVLVAGTIRSVITTPVYGATVQLLIEAPDSRPVALGSAEGGDADVRDYYATQHRILQSRSLARKTLEALELWSHPEFGGPPVAESVPAGGLGRLSAAVRGLAAWATGDDRLLGAPPPEGPREAETLGESLIIDNFLSRLTISPVRDSRLVDLRFTTSSPDLAAAVANGLARIYIEQNRSLRTSADRKAAEWLSVRVAEQRQKLEASELALQQSLEQGNAVALDDPQNIVVQRLTELNGAAMRARLQRIGKEALYRQIAPSGDAAGGAGNDTFTTILGNGFIQELKTRLADLDRERVLAAEKLGERHPEMVRLTTAIRSTRAKLDREIAKVREAVRNDYLAAKAEEETLGRAVEAQKAEALALNRKGIDHGVLRRDAQSNRQLYESLMQRLQEANLARELEADNVRVLDPAEVPRSPLTPRMRRDVSVALAGGLALGLVAAFFFEALDSTLKDRQDVMRHLRLPLLGIVPALPEKLLRARVAPPLVSDAVPAPFAEAYSTVRANIVFTAPPQGHRALMVTSAHQSEGKSLTSCNLAIGLAQTGQRVLLVDADFRRSCLHQLFGQHADPGLSNIIAGTHRVIDAIRQTEVRGLWLVTAGDVPPNPAQLLAADRFRSFLRSATERFDWVIIDSPPVMPVSDALVIANAADGVVFVVAADTTSRTAARSAIDRLEAARARFAGVILNAVNLDRHPESYSSYYHEGRALSSAPVRERVVRQSRTPA
jgi:capsular exopolysaccharide synthesis family protein